MSHGYYIKNDDNNGLKNEKDVLLEKHTILCVHTLLPIALRLSNMLNSTGHWALTEVLCIFALK